MTEAPERRLHDPSAERLPYGSWPSPITAESLTTAPTVPEQVRLDGPCTYWLEPRPHEAGRMALVRHDGARASDVLPPPWNLRTRVHEYGGGAYHVRDGEVVFSDATDARLYRLDRPGAEPVAITPEVTTEGNSEGNSGAVRYGGIARHGHHLYVVREDHHGPGEPVNELVRLDVTGPNDDLGTVLFSGADFVGEPALSADGARIAWISWDHPDMSWDQTTLHLAEVTPEGLANERAVAGLGAGRPETSILQPRFDAAGRLWFVSDATDWWNLWRLDPSGETDAGPDAAQPTPVVTAEADLAQPGWVLGLRDYALLGDGRVLLRDPADPGCLAMLAAPEQAGAVAVPERIASAAEVTDLVAEGAAAAAVIHPTDRPAQVLRIGPGGVVALTEPETPDPDYVPRSRVVSWGNSSGLTAYGHYYPPTHPDVSAPDGELPPLLVFVHGGPTGHAYADYRPMRQFWTSRGFAILDVNHGGSAGFGRAYRNRLRGGWGVVDNDDIVTGARAMGEQGLADGARLAIRGGSAGGYATLRALTTSTVFAAGTSLFGISDLSVLMTDTHKFESQYPQRLIGPWPEQAAEYADRSPINHLDRLHGALLLLQGADDLVVPLNQAESMADAMRAAGKQVELVVYPGEGHGFRRADTNADAYRRELAHYADVFGFRPPQEAVSDVGA